MEKKRLFTATFIEPAIFDFKYDEIQADSIPAVGGKWVEPGNLHFTYKFLGDVNAELIPEIKENLSTILTEYNSPLILKGLGVFRNVSNPIVLFAKVFYSAGILSKIYREMEDIFYKMGFEKETRNFMPHITLLRPKYSDPTELKLLLYKYKHVEFGIMDSFKIDLVESKLTPKGPIYKRI